MTTAQDITFDSLVALYSASDVAGAFHVDAAPQGARTIEFSTWKAVPEHSGYLLRTRISELTDPAGKLLCATDKVSSDGSITGHKGVLSLQEAAARIEAAMDEARVTKVCEVPAGLKHVKALTFAAFERAWRGKRLAGAFELEVGTKNRRAFLYLDKQAPKHDLSQDVWFEYVPERNTVNYVVRVVDHAAGEALLEAERELSMAQAAILLDESIEQQLGLLALGDQRARFEASKYA